MREITCRYCGRPGYIAECYDTRWRLFDPATVADPETPDDMRWVLARASRRMTRGSDLPYRPRRFNLIHRCSEFVEQRNEVDRLEAELTLFSPRP